MDSGDRAREWADGSCERGMWASGALGSGRGLRAGDRDDRHAYHACALIPDKLLHLAHEILEARSGARRRAHHFRDCPSDGGEARDAPNHYQHRHDALEGGDGEDVTIPNCRHCRHHLPPTLEVSAPKQVRGTRGKEAGGRQERALLGCGRFRKPRKRHEGAGPHQLAWVWGGLMQSGPLQTDATACSDPWCLLADAPYECKTSGSRGVVRFGGGIARQLVLAAASLHFPHTVASAGCASTF